MATANKQVATIFNKYNESMKSICQHCGSHFDYLATELTDTLKVSEGAEQTMTKKVLSVFYPLYDIYKLYIYHYSKLIYLYRIHILIL